jgi:ATP-dependent Zn protease
VVNGKKPQWLLPLTLLLFGLFWFSLQYSPRAEQPKQVSYSEFLSEVRRGDVAEVGIDEQLIIATLKTEPANKEAAHQISTQRLPGIDETSLLGEDEPSS